jgi:glycerol uptake facilitator-like aquaporin
MEYSMTTQFLMELIGTLVLVLLETVSALVLL